MKTTPFKQSMLVMLLSLLAYVKGILDIFLNLGFFTH